MDHHGQVVLLSRRPDRLPVRIVERHPGRTDREDADRPGLLAAAADLGDGRRNIADRDVEHAREPVRVRCAVVLEEAVIRLVHRHLDRDIIQAGKGRQPA